MAQRIEAYIYCCSIIFTITSHRLHFSFFKSQIELEIQIQRSNQLHQLHS